MSSDNIELALCPFCGGAAELMIESSYYEVGCTNEACYATGLGHVEKSEAIAAWNRRVGTLRADWSQAPEWAVWWAISADGCVTWYDAEPQLLSAFGEWTVPLSVEVRHYRMIDIPLGIDWRLLKRQRPTANGAGA